MTLSARLFLYYLTRLTLLQRVASFDGAIVARRLHPEMAPLLRQARSAIGFNFFFHYSMVYAIARQAGVPVGKADFDGYHLYPHGFSFGAVPTLSPSPSTGIDPCNS